MRQQSQLVISHAEDVIHSIVFGLRLTGFEDFLSGPLVYIILSSEVKMNPPKESESHPQMELILEVLT